MKRLVMALAASAIMMTSAVAAEINIGVSMAYFDDLFLTKVREAMAAQAKELGVQIHFEDAQGDIGKQLNHIQNFTAQKMSAIIVNPVDTSATPRMTKLATNAKVPLVYVNRKPAEENLPQGVVFVGSDENVSGKLEGEEIARLLNNKGNIAILVGELATQAAELRTQGVEKVAAQHPDMKIVAKQTANWRRSEAIDVVNNWLVSGTKIDAIAANNDEMAIGAIIALQQAGKDPKKLVIGGVDATADALAEMEKGNLDVTVFQDGKGQGKGAVEAAVKLAKGEKVESFVWIPFELVTKDNYKEFLNK
ncbi:MAG TPA: sugar ABC transporter substrate-binding protein [Candidatus Competibacteraceae bacterium]|nr:sugar ABC transporter substrate-binding protein [Candidatus Competibacteraceae bacterium]